MLRQSDAYLATKVNDELVMLNVTTGDFIGLTVTAAAVWDALEMPAGLEHVCQVLENQFTVGRAQCRAEVGALVTDLIARGVLLNDRAG